MEKPKKLSTETNGYLIGNGSSRKGFDLETLRGKGPIFGCNALYRDFKPDVLCALDNGILLEIRNHGYDGTVAKLNKSHTAAVLGDQIIEAAVPRGKGIAWYTGIFSAWLMCSTKPDLKRIFLLGYDLYNAKNNNVYAGSLNYEKMGINEKIQFENFKNLVFNAFPEITFLRVVENESDSPLPDEWILVNNIRNISYEDFEAFC